MRLRGVCSWDYAELTCWVRLCHHEPKQGEGDLNLEDMGSEVCNALRKQNVTKKEREKIKESLVLIIIKEGIIITSYHYICQK